MKILRPMSVVFELNECSFHRKIINLKTGIYRNQMILLFEYSLNELSLRRKGNRFRRFLSECNKKWKTNFEGKFKLKESTNVSTAPNLPENCFQLTTCKDILSLETGSEPEAYAVQKLLWIQVREKTTVILTLQL